MPDFDTITMTPYQHGWDYNSYDKAAAQLFNPLKLVDSAGIPTARPIPLIFATPERAWSLMRRKFKKQIAENPNFRIPLPFLSLQQIGDATFDPSRYLYRKILYRRVAIDTQNYESALAHPHPLPFTFQYSCELWTKTRLEARVAIAQFAALWDEGGMLYRKIDHGTPLGIKIIPFFLEGITDNTNLEASDQQRSLRWTFSFRVEGWLQPPTITQKLVHQLNVQIEMPENLCEENPYEDAIVADYMPLHKGNPDTGEIVEDDEAFDPAYSGTDYRLSQFSTGNPCVEL